MSIASDYVSHGMALVPLRTGKSPRSPGWNKLENVITDPERASELLGNIGLAHAYSTSPTMALDVDDLLRAEVWLAKHGVELDMLRNAADAVQIESGREGRIKLLYALPSGCAPRESISIKETVLVDGEERQVTVIEFRCATRDGLTVQDVLPPSIHPDTGQPYRWGGRGDWRAIPEIPDRLLAIWQDEISKQPNRGTRRHGALKPLHPVEDTPRRRALVDEMLGHISADCSYERYRDIVWAVLSLGWEDVEDIAEAWCRTAPERFEDINFYNVVNSHDQSRTPTIGTLYYHAREGGWHG